MQFRLAAYGAKPNSKFFMTVFVLPLFLGGVLMAQEAEMSGVIKDPSGAAVPRATVTLEDKGTKRLLKTASHGDGLYSFPIVSPGIYNLVVVAPGFETKVVDDLNFTIGAKLTRDVNLIVGSNSQSVSVNGTALEINTVDGSVSTSIDRQFVENVPLNGRSFQSLLMLVPGVSQVTSYGGTNYSGEMSVNGQRTEANYFLVDGVSVNIGAGHAYASTPGRGAGFAGLTPGVTALGTTQSLVSIDALQEFRAATSTYSAEYGRTPGGQFAFNTRSGTNQWHRSAFDYLRNGALDANNWFNNQSGIARPAERQNDFGGTLGGPVIVPHVYDGRDKTFFFFSYEGLRLQVPQAASTFDSPSVALREQAPLALQPFLKAFPIPNGANQGNGTALFTGASSSPASLDSLSLRVDHNIGDSLRLFGRYSGSPSDFTNRYSNDLATQIKIIQNIHTLTLGGILNFSSRVVNDARFNQSWVSARREYTTDNYGGAVPLPLSQIPGFDGSNSGNIYLYIGIGTSPSYVLTPRTVNQQQQNFVDTVSVVRGRHTLKFGFDYRRVYDHQILPSAFEVATFTNAADILADNPTPLSLISYFKPINAVYNNYSIFAQDEWKASQRLSLSLGLRWDINPPPGDSAGNLPYAFTSADVASFQLAPKGTQLWKTDYKGFAPRLGMAWLAHDEPGTQTVVRSGFGLFYDTGGAYASVGYGDLGNAGTVVLPAGTAFPLSAGQIAAYTPSSVLTKPYVGQAAGLDPNLKLPRSMQWNFTVEQQLGAQQTLSLGYVGSATSRLLVVKDYYPNTLGNVNFSPDAEVEFVNNGASSNYQSLQARFQRRLSHGLQALASYTWSHSIDNASSNFDVYELLRASSDFDIRHNFQAALTYDLPKGHNRAAAILLNGWSLDLRFLAQSAAPIDLIGSEVIDPRSGADQQYQPDYISGQPFYLYGSQYPGGKAINFNAFTASPNGEGNFGRNILRGFGAVQLDSALHRTFSLRERAQLQIRLEAFNLLNHPIFGGVDNYLSDGSVLFGLANTTANNSLGGLNPQYQTGGPRSLQVSLRLRF